MSKRRSSTSGRRRKPRLDEMASAAAQALWDTGGPLHGFKNIPWAIATVGTDGRTFTVKGTLRDDERREENMVLQLIALVGWPRPASQELKVDAFYPEHAFFAECHESQHVDPRHIFNTRRSAGYADQRATDMRKSLALVRQGFYGIVIAAFDGPFHEQHWMPVANAEVRRRTALAMRTLLAVRADAYARGDYAGRMLLFSSPTADDYDTEPWDGVRVGRRFLGFAEIDAVGRDAAALFAPERIAELRAAHALFAAALARAAPIVAGSNDASSDDDVAPIDAMVGGEPVACAFCGDTATEQALVSGMMPAPICSRACARRNIGT